MNETERRIELIKQEIATLIENKSKFVEQKEKMNVLILKSDGAVEILNNLISKIEAEDCKAEDCETECKEDKE